MAKPITQISPETPKEPEAGTELREALDAHHDSLLSFLRLLSDLEDAGVLAFARSLVEQRGPIADVVVDLVNEPANREGIQNLLLEVMAVARLPASVVPLLENGVSQGLRNMEQQRSVNPPILGAWGLLKALKNPDVNRGLSMVLAFLAGLGQGAGEPDDERA